MNIHRVSFGHPDAVELNDRVQLEYAARFGKEEGDITPLGPAMFEPPQGLFLIVYDERGVPVATGGWRGQVENGQGYADGDAEIKRMYVVPEARGRGLSRLVLAALEDDARGAGPDPHGPGDRHQAAGGDLPLHLQRLPALCQVRPVPLR